MTAIIREIAGFAAAHNFVASPDLDPLARPPQIAPDTLLLDVGDRVSDGGGSVLSFYHRVCEAAERLSIPLDVAAIDVLQQVREGTLLATDLPPSVRTCTGCGCVDEYACDRQCFWIAAARCSNCA